jgi:hypothetical protein
MIEHTIYLFIYLISFTVEHTIRAALPIFKHAFPDCEGLWLFDNAPGHNCFAQDALVTSRMRKGSGLKQSKMREHFIHSKGRPQPMCFAENYPEQH